MSFKLNFGWNFCPRSDKIYILKQNSRTWIFFPQEDAHSNFSYSMTLCQRLCVQEVIEVGNWKLCKFAKIRVKKYKVEVTTQFSGRVWLHPPPPHFPGKLGFNESLQTDQGARWQCVTKWYHLYTEVLTLIISFHDFEDFVWSWSSLPERSSLHEIFFVFISFFIIFFQAPPLALTLETTPAALVVPLARNRIMKNWWRTK